MEFEITCPIDGPVTVSLEDIDTVVLREPHRAEITFVCPQCGEHVTVQAIVPHFLVAAIQQLAEDGDLSETPFGDLSALLEQVQSQIRMEIDEDENTGGEGEPVATAPLPEPLANEVAEAYTEYFRRQLEHCDSVEDALREIDSRQHHNT
jgi:hypothetical protein